MAEKNKRGANWTTDEELALIDHANQREDALFGKMKGCGDVKIATIRQNGWKEICDILNARFTVRKRTAEEVKKKYYNLKQRSREKYDLQKRPKTGGGPAAKTTQAEELLISHMIEEKRTQLTGFPDGVDTDTIASQPECSGSWISRQKEALDAYKELSERNLVTTAKKMAVKIENFLDTHTVVTPVPRANDIHIMDTLKGISQSEVEQDESQSDLLVNYLCHTYSCLRNLKTPDLPSLINDLVIFIKENTYKESTQNEELDGQIEADKEPTCIEVNLVEEQEQNGERTSVPSSNPKGKGKGNIKRGRRSLAELEEENLMLDNERLREETKKIKMEQENLKLAKEVFILKKQTLICKLQSEFPDCVQILNEP
ncbi:myb/SANT-like DNA-binding domain-containing protein 4 isoform X1 [Mytilus edulis]|uniref:myb/SANT-like DNA-binding domain-containing protein 4 isoform X1 n=1 Tax=Mytilus edulis TaxID=6550 RepID=UPI0039EDF993